ncbi:MAG TPA: hypothetical protein VJB94_04135 [Candidatus Nanoarchaeia archaeon]|nr:hypothetical protein [Candidatus Nanoarchaeia archaeon]
MSETTLITLIVVIIIGIAFFVYYKYSSQSYDEARERISEEESSVLLAYIASMPEISCEDNCIDASKLLAFKSLSNSKDYIAVFGNKKITIEQAYPAVNSTEECTALKLNQASYPGNCRYWMLYERKPKLFSSTYIVSTPYSIYYPETDSHGIAIIKIEVYL